MTVRDGELKRIMRHSSSWPERAVAVKVRINPETRAYTIIPTFYGDNYCCELSARIADEGAVNGGDKKSVSSEARRICIVEIEDDGSSEILKNEDENRDQTIPRDVGTAVDDKKSSKKLSRNFSFVRKSLSDLSPPGITGDHRGRFMQELSMMDSENPMTSERREKPCKNQVASAIKSLPQTPSKVSHFYTKNETWPIAFDGVSANIGSVRRSKSLKCDSRSKLGPNSKPRGVSVLSKTSSNENEGQIITLKNNNGEADEDVECNERDIDVLQGANHACPKCTAEGLLQLKIDPFRVPVEAPQPSTTSKRNCPESGTFTARRYRSQSTRYESKADFAKTNLAQRSKSFGGNFKNNADNGSSGKHVMDQRKEATLRRHYYPEGGWGYVIVTCSALVHFLGIGLQLSAPGTWHVSAELKFHHPPLHTAGGFLAGGCLAGGCFLYIAQCTIKQHYYPESGWGWVVVVTGVLVHILGAGIHGAIGIWLTEGMRKYRQPLVNVGWLGAMSTGVALLVSPVTIAFCRRKSTRVTAVLGGLVTALGCLFTSFASQFHQLFFSYGTVVGIGVGMTRDCSTLMVAQYFKRRREFVEIFIVSGSGLGIAVMSAFIKGAISKIGWRLGLQAVTGVVFLTFILGTFYRSASLYHPQRRAILHLKNQKRKIKDKNKVDDRPPFFDFSTLKSKTVRILLVSTGISAFGINTPIFYLAHQAEEEGLGDTVVLLQAYLGLAWTLGCVAFGLLVVHHSVECRIARQYLTQAAVFMCGLCILALTAVHGNYHGYVMFTWIYGIFCGGYHYSLKMYTYERVRARNFARTWGFVQCSQAIPIAIGVPISGYINVGCGGKAGYYFSSTCVLVGSFTLFFIDLHRRSLSRHKHTRANGTRHLCVSDNCPQRRRLSFSQEPENEGVAAGAAAAALMLGAELAPAPGEVAETLAGEKPELTCISEEGIADMDLPDNLLDDLDYIGDCITSCNKVENYLMLSEFENNLIAEMPIILDRKGRRWSLARSKGPAPGSQGGGSQGAPEEDEVKPKWRLMTAPPNNRVITVIDEAST